MTVGVDLHEVKEARIVLHVGDVSARGLMWGNCGADYLLGEGIQISIQFSLECHQLIKVLGAAVTPSKQKHQNHLHQI